MKEYTKQIYLLLCKYGNELAAQSMTKANKGQFKFLGIKTTELKELTKSIFERYALPKYDESKSIIRKLFSFEEREFLYFGITLFANRKKMWKKTDIVFIESLILNQPGWDTTDRISEELISQFYEMYPEVALEFINSWSESKNQWLKSVAIMFQRKMKEKTDKDLLRKLISDNLTTNNKIVNKAIGSALRDYSKVNHKWVLDFVVQNSDKMDKRTKQEAIKWIDSKKLIK